MIAKITQKHIDKGKLQDCQHCPVALCLNEMSNFNWSVSGITMLALNPYTVIDTPNEVAEWLRNFDFSGGIRIGSTLPKPFEFHISAEAFMR